MAPKGNRRRQNRAVPARRQNTTRSRWGSVFDRANWRMMILTFALGSLFGVVGMRLMQFSVIPSEVSGRIASHAEEMPLRGNLYDRNGVLLATSVPAYAIFADPKYVQESGPTARKLAKILSQDANRIQSKLEQQNRFVWLSRQVSPHQAQLVHNLGLPGVGVREISSRLYPQQHQAAHVIGAVNIDGRGLAGAEAEFDEELQAGKDVTLSIDMRLQTQLEETLYRTLEKSEAKGVAGIVTDPRTGDILAMASLPDYDPNRFSRARPEDRFNHVTQGVYEMGSTFKLFTVAQAVEQGKTTLTSMHDCTHPLKVANFTIRDYYGKDRYLSTAEVIQYSSNIGAARMAAMLGPESYQRYFHKLNLDDRVRGIGITSAAPLLPYQWGPTETATVSYGHGIAVTPLHVATAIGALVTDGVVKAPKLRPDMPVQPVGDDVVSGPEIRQMVRGLMHLVVNGGTASGAQVVGYNIGGKTGTAQKLLNGKYQTGVNVSSFVGAVPIDKPELLAVMLVDEGKKGLNTGGRVAAPAFGDLMTRILPLAGIAPAEHEAVFQMIPEPEEQWKKTKFPSYNMQPSPTLPVTPLEERDNPTLLVEKAFKKIANASSNALVPVAHAQ